MRKLLLVAATGMVALYLGGCGGDGSGNNTASPTPSPTPPTPAAPGSPPPGTPNNPQAFPSPVVTQQPNLISVPGLIQSTNPEERAKQAQADIETKNRNARTVPLAQPSPTEPVDPSSAGNDPFSVLPPQPVRNLPEVTVGGTPQIPKQSDQTVPDLPDIPSPIDPPQWTRPRIPRFRGGPSSPGGSVGPGNPFSPGGSVGPGNPLSPGGSVGPGNPFSPGGSRGPSGPGIPQLPKPGEGTGIPDLPKQPIAAGPPPWNRPASPLSRPSGPTIPRLPKPPEGTGIPDLPKQPVNAPPPSWRNPNPPRPRPAPARPAVPPPPSTDLAEAVEVTGVVRVGNRFLVILRAPNEPTSRYVRVGQRIANGQVLVKRVQFRADSDPIVVLEQNGVEVSKVVGEKVLQPPDNSANQ